MIINTYYACLPYYILGYKWKGSLLLHLYILISVLFLQDLIPDLYILWTLKISIKKIFFLPFFYLHFFIVYKPLGRRLTFNRSQPGNCSATLETLTQKEVVYKWFSTIFPTNMPCMMGEGVAAPQIPGQRLLCTRPRSSRAAGCQRVVGFFFFFWCGLFFFKPLLNLLQYHFCFMCFGFFGCEVWGILAPWPWIEPEHPALEGKVLTPGPPGKSLHAGLQVTFWQILHHPLGLTSNVKLSVHGFQERLPSPTHSPPK